MYRCKDHSTKYLNWGKLMGKLCPQLSPPKGTSHDATRARSKNSIHLEFSSSRSFSNSHYRSFDFRESTLPSVSCRVSSSAQWETFSLSAVSPWLLWFDLGGRPCGGGHDGRTLARGHDVYQEDGHQMKLA